MIVDKRNLLPDLRDVTLELGCGAQKRHDGAVGIDLIDYDCVDIVGDIYDVARRIPDQCINAVHSYHFFEHVRDIALLMAELARVLKPKGILEIVVPHFSNPYYYSDYTHKNFFGLYSLSYFAQDSLLKRRVPHYNSCQAFDLCEVDLVFKSSPPFYTRHLLKRALGKVFNLNCSMKELYEENFCYLFPCYEIRYLLRRKA